MGTGLQGKAVLLRPGRRVLQKVAHALIPSFADSNSKPVRLHPTSYLDGLRGVASFIVFMGHYTESTIGWFTEPYGLYEDNAPSSPLQLPFIRVLYSGRPMVSIFFIISGFVLSYKPLKQIHAQQYEDIAHTLSSSVFRRAMRLFLPSLINMLITAVGIYSGITAPTYGEQFPTLSLQLKAWYNICWKFIGASWLLDSHDLPRLNPALWTIPVEFAQSLLLFLAVLGLSRCTTQARFILLGLISVFCFQTGRHHTIEFLGGMFFAEVVLLQNASTPSPPPNLDILPMHVEEKPIVAAESNSQVKPYLVQAFWLANLACGLYIASWTNHHVEGVWGLRFLNAHTPAPYKGQRIWFCLGAFQIVGACTQVRTLQRLFASPVPQYLGNISYALYLMHNVCLQSLQPQFGPFIDEYIGTATLGARHMVWLTGLVLYLPVIICVSDLFWRVVDIPTVKLARWLEGKCVLKTSP
ncbi:hypothetical protein B7463_g5002, partial [Scytalidium lignicola]